MTLATHDVWEQFRDALHRFLQRRVGNDHVAEDLLQEVFLRIHRGLPALKNDQRIGPWVYRIARNAVTDHYRRKRVSAVNLVDHEPAQPNEPEVIDPQLAACLRMMLECLPAEQRDAVVRVDLEGESQGDYAKAQAMSLSGAKSRVQRGRRLLKKNLLDCCTYEMDYRGRPLSSGNHHCDADCGCDLPDSFTGK
ncbi:MAG: RNA polymerase sigma factor SigZ [Algisphaera sp.]